jgi:hypothetical protein
MTQRFKVFHEKFPALTSNAWATRNPPFTINVNNAFPVLNYEFQHCAMKEYRGVEVQLHHSSPSQYEEESGHLHAPEGKQSAVPSGPQTTGVDAVK